MVGWFKSRLPYIIAAVVLLIVEILIGLFVHDGFVRPYIGDVLVAQAEQKGSVGFAYTFPIIFQ